MEQPKSKTATNELLKCLMRTVLVLGLFAFSGPVSEYRIHLAEPTKTELKEVNLVRSKKAVYFKKVSDRLNFSCPCPIDRTEIFRSSLRNVENAITEKLRRNLKEVPGKEQYKKFLLFHASVKSKEFDSHQARG